MNFRILVVCILITYYLSIYPQFEQGSVSQVFDFKVTQSMPVSFTNTYQRIPKVVISILHLDIVPNIAYGFTMIQSASLTGFTIRLTSLTANSYYAMTIFYLITSDQYVELHQNCIANPQQIQTFQYKSSLSSYSNIYQTAPQVTLYLTGFTITNVSPTLIGFRIEAQGITSTKYQIYSISRSNNLVTNYCYNAIIMPSNLGLSIPLYYNLYTSPVIAPSSPSHTSTTLIYKENFIQNTNIIHYGCSGLSYLGSSGLRSLLAYVVQGSNQISNRFQTWDGSSLYEYSVGILLYQPKQCGVNGVDAQCLPVCGDGIVHQTEDCDDQNNNPFDGCSNCQYSCVVNCQSCFKGMCSQCNSGYQLDIAQNCIPICGDGIIQDLEQCEGFQQTIFNGCFNCQFQCQIECLLCELGKCRQCLNGYKINPFHICEPICGDGLIVGNEECDDGYLVSLGTCFQCQLVCSANCIYCHKGICQACLDGYYLSSLNDCNPICGDFIVAGNEQCDQAFQHYKKCFNCQYYCDDNCKICQFGICFECKPLYSLNISSNNCEPICGNEVVQQSEQCDDGNLIPYDGCWNCQYDCPRNCQLCIQGICIQCNIGYYDNYYNLCNSLCGDGIVTRNEQCDDGNDLFFDGCYTCNWSCIANCQTCFNGVCQNCQLGYYLFNQQCYSICGDNIVTAEEECDDGNSYPFDNCHQCQKSCSKYCLYCSNGFCLSCQNGYYLKDNKCTALCGDQITVDSEQCDDGNIDIYDGCYNCTIGCPQATFLQYYRCTNVCGDGLVAIDLEQCDDGNQISRDGCSNCLVDNNYVCTNIFNSKSICYVCPLNCNSCYQGICSSCINGYFLNSGICIQCDQQCITCTDYPSNCVQFIFQKSQACDAKQGLYPNYNTQQCYSICGDSIKTQFEQCDDGNLLSGDGCNNQCLIETGWKCDNLNPSYCHEQFLPILQITLQQQTNLLIQQLLVQLSYPCFVYNQTKTNLTIISSEQNLEISQFAQFNFSMKELQTISYLVQITPLEQIQNAVLYVFLPNNTFQTKQSVQLFNLSNKIILFDLNYVSTNTQIQISKISDWNSYLLYTIIGICILSLFVGSFEPILNMLDLMQYLSYLKYIDIPFPYILSTYFNIFSIVSMDLVIQSLGLTSINTYPFVTTSYKFQYYETNAYFLQIFRVSYLLYFKAMQFMLFQRLLNRQFIIVNL